MWFTKVVLTSFIYLYGVTNVNASPANKNEMNNIVERGNEIVDEALIPVYEMMKVFLEDIIQPNDLTYMEEKGVDFSDPDIILDSFVNNYEDWIWYFLGYAALIAVGVILMLVMCCAACCTCMCRTCCGQCGGKVHPIHVPNPRSDPESCKRVCCGVLLFVVLTFVFLGSLTMYFTAVRIHSELTTDDGLFYSISDGLTMIDDYVDHTVQDMEDGVLGIYNETVDKIFGELEGVVTKSYTELDQNAGINENMEPLLKFSSEMPFMSTALGNAQNNASNLQTQVEGIEANLTTVKTDIINAIDNACSGDKGCDDMATKVNNTNIAVNYSDIHGSFAPLILAFNVAITEDLHDKLNGGYQNFKAIISDVNNSVVSQIDVAKNEAESLGREMSSELDKIQEELDSISFNETVQDLQEIGDGIKEPTDYAFYGVAGIAGIVLLLVLFGYFGLFLGCFCPQPKPGKGGCCTKKTGATCLLAGVGFTFIFFFILMIMLMLLMLTGGILHTELCRHLVHIDESPVMAIIDEVMNETLFEESGFYINISDIYINCRDDKAFYTALKVEETFGFDLDTILNVSAIKKEIENIRNQPITLDPINILSIDALFFLTELANKVDSTKGKIKDAKDELSKQVTSEDLTQLANELEALDQVKVIPGLSSLISKLRDINDYVDDVDDQRAITFEELAEVHDILDRTNLTARVEGLKNGNDTVNNYGADIISGVIYNTTYQLEVYVDEAVYRINNSVRNEIGRCAPVYNAYSILVDSGCVEILYPYNGYWFALGWSLIFLIVDMIMSFKLATLYRRTYLHKNAVHPRTYPQKNAVPPKAG